MNERGVKVSVIMACYNSSRYLDESINSVLRQTLRDLELIVIDDCSVDNSLKVARRYQLQDDRVSVLLMASNSGPALARNAGIRAARGEWIGILDSDDVAIPSRFEEQLKLANSDNSVVMIGSDSISIDKDGSVIKYHTYPTAHSSLVRRLTSRRAFPPHSSAVYKREAVVRLSAFNPRFVLAEDCDLLLRLSEIGRLGSVGRTLVKIRKHREGISNWEEGAQMVHFGVIAIVCHLLRIGGWPDPSTSSDEAAWQGFQRWINTRMSEEGYYERQKLWTDSRAEYLATANRLTGALRFSRRILRSGHFSTLVWEKFLGSSLPKQLAWEWRKPGRLRNRRSTAST